MQRLVYLTSNRTTGRICFVWRLLLNWWELIQPTTSVTQLTESAISNQPPLINPGCYHTMFTQINPHTSFQHVRLIQLQVPNILHLPTHLSTALLTHCNPNLNTWHVLWTHLQVRLIQLQVPDATVVVRSGGTHRALFVSIAMLVHSNVTICSASTFCFQFGQVNWILLLASYIWMLCLNDSWYLNTFWYLCLHVLFSIRTGEVDTATCILYLNAMFEW